MQKLGQRWQASSFNPQQWRFSLPFQWGLWRMLVGPSSVAVAAMVMVILSYDYVSTYPVQYRTLTRRRSPSYDFWHYIDVWVLIVLLLSLRKPDSRSCVEVPNKSLVTLVWFDTVNRSTDLNSKTKRGNQWYEWNDLNQLFNLSCDLCLHTFHTIFCRRPLMAAG